MTVFFANVSGFHVLIILLEDPLYNQDVKYSCLDKYAGRFG